MPINTNLNTAPYYDDFDEDDNFHRVLFRPGFALQARELTQLQSILQNQIEQQGRHTFADGAMVIPGHQIYDNKYQAVRLSGTFGGESIDVAQFYNADNPVTITGQTSGVTAEVIGFSLSGDQADEPMLFVNYVSSGNSGDADPNSENFSIFFQDGEALSADIPISHTTSYGAGVSSLNVFSPTDPNVAATHYGSSVKVNAGVYFVKGQFVKNDTQTIVLGYNNPRPNARVGFQITEEIITPESDTSLLDNATGTSNFTAKGAHRLKINLTLTSKELDSSDDADFVEIMRIVDGEVITKTKETEYSLLGKALADRTYEESGNYIVKPFKIDVKETVDNFRGKDLFLGEYEEGDTTDEFVIAQDDFVSVKIQPGIAYINGYRQETLGLQRKDLLKARNVKTMNDLTVNAEIGNFFRIENVFGTPDIGDISNETTPYRPILLFDSKQSSRGTISDANPIGVFRVRSFEHESSGDAAGASSSNTTSIYRLYAFDVRTFVELIMSDTPSPLTTSNFSSGGVQVTGVDSGATGFVFNDTTSFPDTTFTSGKKIFLTNVVGTFQSGEKIKVSDGGESDLIVENSSNTDLTITTSTIRKLSDARAIQMQESDSGQDFIADIVLDVLDPSDQSFFSDEQTSSNKNINIQLEDGVEGGEGRLQLNRLTGARLQEPEKLQSIFKLPKDVVKTLLTEDNNEISDTEMTLRRQFVGTTSASGVVSFSSGSGETFVGFAEKDFSMSILTAGGGTGSQGDIVSISGKTSGHNTSTLTITDNTILGSAAKVKLLATIKKTGVASAIKTTNLSKQLRVLASDADGAYGTRATDKDISLGRTDVFNIQAIYDSENSSSDATAPTLTVSSITSSFVRGERIKGVTSGARGRLITTGSPLQYTLIFGQGAPDFQAGETIQGEFSGATAVIDSEGVTAGSKIVTQDFRFDDGQRNNYYDISRLTRKEGRPTPTGRLLVVYDFFSHGAGNFFSVDSYSSVAGMMEYEDIPTFIATTVDPDDPVPASTFPLADCVDFRPTVENIAGTSELITTVDQVTTHSFDHGARQYDGTGSVVVDTPKPDSEVKVDFEFYLDKIACLFMDYEGKFQIVEGEPNENLTPPTPLPNSLKIAEFLLPAYTFSAEDIDITYENHLRYTMGDIGKLENRIEQLEYYTALSLLESETLSKEIFDQNGLNRFKSGFVIDNFQGHGVGDQTHEDYNVAVDPEERELRPRTVDKAAELVLSVRSTSEQAAAGFQQTGKLVTLPYTNESILNNEYNIIDTSTVGVDPNPNAVYAGRITELDPSEDEWYEADEVKTLFYTDTTEYDQAVRDNNGQVQTYTYGDWRNHSHTRTYGGGNKYGIVGYTGTNTGKIKTHGMGRHFKPYVHQFTTERKKIRTMTIKKIGYSFTKSTSKNTVTQQVKFCRPKGIKFTAVGLKPNTKHFVFFGGQKVDRFSGPLEEQFAFTPSEFTPFSNTDVDVGDSLDIVPGREQPNEGLALATNNKGELKGFFLIPDHRGKQNSAVPKFETGDVEFLLTSNTKNDKLLIISSAREIYNANGTQQVTYVTTTTTKKPKVSYENVIQNYVVKGYGYAFGSAYAQELFPTNQLVTLRLKKNEGWLQKNVVNWINNGILLAFKNGAQITRATAGGSLEIGSGDVIQIKVNPIYAVSSPGEYERTSGSKIQGATPQIQEAYYQSFFVSESEGFFAQSLNLYFQTKSKTDPVSVSIVAMEQGLPVNTELPYSLVSLSPDQVNNDLSGETPTSIVFPSPIYLMGGQKYAIKIYSRGDMYKLKTGKESIGETKHPSLSDVFLPGRVNTQGGDNDLHARLRLFRAKFTDNAVNDGGTVILRNKFVGELYALEDSSKSAYGKKLFNANPVELRNSNTNVKIFHQHHGMYSTSNNVRISGVRSGVTTTLNGSISPTATSLVLKSVAGFTEGSIHVPSSGAIQLKIDSELFSGTLSGSTFTISGRGTVGFGDTSGASTSHADGSVVELYMLHGIPLNQINKVHTSIANIDTHSYTISVSTAPTVTGDGVIRVGGTNTFASENYRFETFETYIPIIEPPRTRIGSKIRVTTGTSPSGSETSFVLTEPNKAIPFALNESFDLTDCAIVASNENEQREMASANSLVMDLKMTTDSNFVSPVIDTTNMSIYTIGNVLDNIDSSSDIFPTTDFFASTSPRGDNNSAIYLTKPVQLENTATAIKLFLDVHKPSTSEVKVLFRTLPVEGEEDIQNLDFTFFNSDGLPDDGFAANAQDRSDFSEYKYTAGVNDSGVGEPLQDFQQFQIKIVMQGTDAANPPRIMNLRGIALAT